MSRPEQQLARAREAGVSGWVNTAFDAQGWPRQLQRSDPTILVALGLHPWAVPIDPGLLRQQLNQLGELLDHPRVVALGEIGLDHFRSRTREQRQVAELAFRLQLRLARDRPVVVHAVRCHGLILRILKEERYTGPGMLHSFAGPGESIAQFAERGFYFSLSSRSLPRPGVVEAVPPDRLLLETDAPDGGPLASLRETALAVAQRRGWPLEEVAQRTRANLTVWLGRPIP